MYLSRIMLDTRRMEAIRALAIPTVLHGAIEQSFTGERKRKLWRVDQFSEKCFLLVLSEDKPDFTAFVHQFGSANENGGWETKSYSNFLAQISANQTWRFRLCANPVHSCKENGSSERGKLFAHVTREHQQKWLLSRAEKHGFSLQAENFDITRSEWVKFSKGTAKYYNISIYMAVYEGLLTIIDADLFRGALIDGIGRAKAYGCGLLTIMHP